MACPLCGQRKGRRSCPAVGAQICPVCCGTKRLTEIRCPPDCVYLASAREHPPASVVRQQQEDLARLVHSMRDFNQRQSEVYLLINTFLMRYRPPDLTSLVDEDIAEAASALASTFETAARGVIYEHRPGWLTAERLSGALKPLLAEAGKGAGSAFDRDAAVVLRRVEESVRDGTALDPSNRRAYLDFLGRVLRQPEQTLASSSPGAEPPRLIVP